MVTPQERPSIESAQDPTAVIERFNRLRPKLIRYADSLVHNTEQAEDFVSDVLTKILARPVLWEEIVADAFFYSCVRNMAFNYVRDNGRRSKILDRDDTTLIDAFHDAHASDPELACAQGETRAALARVLDQLKEPHRVILQLRHHEDLSYVEIAERLGIALGTVMSRLCRAHEQLKVLSGTLQD